MFNYLAEFEVFSQLFSALAKASVGLDCLEHLNTFTQNDAFQARQDQNAKIT